MTTFISVLQFHLVMHDGYFVYPLEDMHLNKCGCNNNMAIQQELFSRFLPSMYAGHVGLAGVSPR